ncbi:hypothetical protein H4582DRAFT_2132508 [Lactarius indigo]|nr:hypothetical protein H4582DRAFT_2132508 [Lactarius indigo]
MTVMTTALLGVVVGITVVLCVIGAGVGRRRAAGGRFSRRFGVGRRWHDDFYLGIGIEDVLGLNKLASSGGARVTRFDRIVIRTRAKLERDGARGGLENRRGGYRGGCGPGAKEGVDLDRGTPNLFHRLLPRGAAGRAWERTKEMDGSVGSTDQVGKFSARRAATDPEKQDRSGLGGGVQESCHVQRVTERTCGPPCNGARGTKMAEKGKKASRHWVLCAPEVHFTCRQSETEGYRRKAEKKKKKQTPDLETETKDAREQERSESVNSRNTPETRMMGCR